MGSISKKLLRKRVINHIKSQGLEINPHVKSKNAKKDTYRKIHKMKKEERMAEHKKFLLKNLDLIQDYSIDGRDVNPDKIDLKLVEVKRGTEESRMHFWWNLVWWSLPYQQPIGRVMRFLVWDEYHNAPFGLFCLQSPSIRMKARDDYLGLNRENAVFWINMSLYGQRIGALPPYNELIGSKMVALSISSNEVRKNYEKKYKGRKTLIENRVIPSKLLYITTTSAFGKSSVYDRINFNGEPVSIFIGYTAGAGTFHLSEELYVDMLKFLERKSIDTRRGYGTGPSRKLRLINKGFRLLSLPDFEYHNIKRGIYLFPHAKNLKRVIHENKRPIFYDRPFEELADFWLERWCIPRSLRIDRWKNFDSKKFLNKAERTIKKL